MVPSLGSISTRTLDMAAHGVEGTRLVFAVLEIPLLVLSQRHLQARGHTFGEVAAALQAKEGQRTWVHWCLPPSLVEGAKARA